MEQNAVMDKPMKVCFCFVINQCTMNIGFSWKIDLRFGNVQK